MRRCVASRRRRHRELAVAGVAALAIALLPLVIHDVYLQNILVLTLMYAALSQSWNILGGYCGQISLGHAIYFGIGAYMSTLLVSRMPASRPGSACWRVAGLQRLIALALGYPFFGCAAITSPSRRSWLPRPGSCSCSIGISPAAPKASRSLMGPTAAHLQFAREKLPYIYFALGLAVLTWLVHLRDRGFEMGLLVARREGQCRGRRKPRRRRLPLEDGGGRAFRLLHGDRRQLLCGFRLPISIPTA